MEIKKIKQRKQIKQIKSLLSKKLLNKLKLFLVLLTLFILVSCSSKESLDNSNFNIAEQNVVQVKEQLKETKSSQGEVSVDLTPAKYEQGQFYFDVSINTHTVNDLNKYDLKEITILEYLGKDYHPISALKLNGHHNNGELVFSMDKEPENFVIKITNLHDLSVREFSWP